MSGINNELVRPTAQKTELPDDIVAQLRDVIEPISDTTSVKIFRSIWEQAIAIRNQMGFGSVQPPKELQHLVDTLPQQALDTVCEYIENSLVLLEERTLGELRLIAQSANVRNLFGPQMGSFIENVFGPAQQK